MSVVLRRRPTVITFRARFTVSVLLSLLFPTLPLSVVVTGSLATAVEYRDIRSLLLSNAIHTRIIADTNFLSKR